LFETFAIFGKLGIQEQNADAGKTSEDMEYSK
jgi:hypothetical protein